MRKKKLERTKREERKDKHQIHCVGLHSAKHTHTNRSRSKKKKTKKNLAAEHRAVRQEKNLEREREKKTQWYTR